MNNESYCGRLESNVWEKFLDIKSNVLIFFFPFFVCAFLLKHSTLFNKIAIAKNLAFVNQI